MPTAVPKNQLYMMFGEPVLAFQFNVALVVEIFVVRVPGKVGVVGVVHVVGKEIADA